ncbi:MAG: ribosome biosis GTPase / thiamine phosphate phosphatase [Pseudomonadota bacterium]|nr:ribosome biosis GTPase / thiamine phosphate phosphatase [Pseudomonadota bacterium]
MVANQVGLIINSYGRQFIVEIDGVAYQAVTKSKKTEYVVGDMVNIQAINQEQVQISGLLDRNNLIYRSDQNRSKIIASNIDQILIVIAAKPNCNLNFLNNCLIFAESENVLPIIVLNKVELPESKGLVSIVDELYCRQLEYQVIKLSAITPAGCSILEPLLQGKRSLLLGQSGVGKSTIINQIIPHAYTKTNVISKSEASGCHTTTSAALYHIDSDSDIIDCPGLQEFGLYHLDPDQLIQCFPELRNHAGICKFRNCRHLNEPGCVIQQLYTDGLIDQLRFNLFKSLLSGLYQKKCY